MGLHLIGADQLPPAPAPPPLANSPLPPLPTSTGSANGYSTIHHPTSSAKEQEVPFPNHGYSTVNINRNQKPVISPVPPASGYSFVAEKRTVNGVVKEVGPESKAQGTGGLTGGVADGGESGEAKKLSAMMETLDARLKSIQPQQSSEISK